MASCYILYSERIDSYYIGSTTESIANRLARHNDHYYPCLLYTSDAADERSSVDLGGRRIIKKKTIRTDSGTDTHSPS